MKNSFKEKKEEFLRYKYLSCNIKKIIFNLSKLQAITAQFNNILKTCFKEFETNYTSGTSISIPKFLKKC